MAFVRAVFYGDSIVTGWRGVTGPRCHWSALLCDELSWREINLGVDGMGFVRKRGWQGVDGLPADNRLIDAVVRLSPDVVVLCQAAHLERQEVELATMLPAARRDLRRLREGLPTVPSLLASYSPTPALQDEALDTSLEEACAELDIVYSRAPSRAIRGSADLLCADGVHPNDAGHKAIARALRGEVSSLMTQRRGRPAS